MVKAKGLKQLSNIGGIMGWGLVITSYFYPDSVIKTVGAVAMSASNMLNRANTLVNVGYGEDLPNRLPDMGNDYTDPRSGHTDGETWTKSYLQSDYTDLRSSFAKTQSDYTDLKNSLVNGARKLVTPLEKLQEKYIYEEMGILKRKGGKFSTRLYGNNEEIREEIINFVRNKKELDHELILDKRCKTNTLNTLGNKDLAECITSKDNTKDLIEIMAKYYLRSGYTDGETSAKQFH